MANPKLFTTNTIGGSFPPESSYDAFSRLRVSSPQTLFDSKQVFNNQPLFWDDAQVSGAGTSSTHSVDQASTTLAVSVNTAGTRVRQTFRRFNYQSGKSQLILLTGVLGSPVSGVTREIGLGDDDNGLFFRLSGSTLSVLIRSSVTGSVVENEITQSNWNVDRLDGLQESKSGVLLETDKTQIFVIDFEWLGVGQVRFGVVIDGEIIYCHKVDNSNTLTTVYMSTPNLPMRYYISNDGTGGAANIVCICATAISEGGRQLTGVGYSVDRGTTALVTNNNTNIYPLVAIRLKSQGIQVTLSKISVLLTSISAFRWCLLLNPTVTGTAFSFSDVDTSSGVQKDVSRTNTTTISGGTQLDSGYAESTESTSVLINLVPSDWQLGYTIAGVSDILVLGVQRITGAAETFYGALAWVETQ